jgi:NAD(P)H-nitrite reductase large subunit
LDFILKTSVQEFKGNSAVLTSGQKVEFDLLIVAVGVKPNTQLVAEAGAKVNRGVVTDKFCCSSLPDIYAAGDCAESYDITTGESRVLALLPNAYMQGECAGINMAGGQKAFEKAIPMNAIGFFGLHIITAGSYDGDAHFGKGDACLGDNVNGAERTYKKLVTKDGLLKGYILVGDVARAGIYTSLIRDQRPLESIDFELIKDKPQLMAFSRAEREKMLGGG